MVSKQDAYHTLGLNSDSTSKDVEKRYKQLALEWYPQKHNYSALANQKFKEISEAYLVLTKARERKDENMSMTEMLDIFQKVFFGEKNVIEKDEMDSCDSDYSDHDDYTDSDDSYFERGPSLFASLSGIVGAINAEAEAKARGELAQKAMQNANELIADEEKEKRKAAKRKAKKKRRKLKKKLEKDSSDKSHKKGEGEKSISQSRGNDSNASASEVEEEGLDPTSAFVAVAVSKSKVTTQVQPKPEIKHSCTNGTENSEENVQDINPHVLQSRELAIRGNMMANIEEFPSAIGLFTDAIKLDPTEFKYFCNRSYCYHQLSQFDRALKDADKAIALQPTWPKGYFRKGQALTGLKRYVEAEGYFRRVLALDKNCSEAIQELKRTQTCQLIEMGFSEHQSERALEDHVNMQEAMEALLSGVYSLSLSAARYSLNGPYQLQQQQLPPHPQVQEEPDEEIYMSDEDDKIALCAPLCQTPLRTGGASVSTRSTVPLTLRSGVPSASNGVLHSASSSMSAPASSSGAAAPARSAPLRTVAHLAAPNKGQMAAMAKAGITDFKTDTRNPEGKASLWIGNVRSQVTEKMLMTLFSKYGELISIRLLPERHCAFINYREMKAAGKAMEFLQGYECCGDNLLIRFPDKNHAFGQAFVMKKKGTDDKTEVKEKLRGPVAGDECYFWRTTGCNYGDNCHYRHVKENKGINNKFK